MKLHWGGLGQWSRLSVVDKRWVPSTRWAFAHRNTHTCPWPLNHAVTQTQHQKSRHSGVKLFGETSQRKKKKKHVLVTSYFTGVLFAFERRHLDWPVRLHKQYNTIYSKLTWIYYTMTGTQSRCLLSNWFVAHQHISSSAFFFINPFTFYFFLQLLVSDCSPGGNNKLSQTLWVKASISPSKIHRYSNWWRKMWLGAWRIRGHRNLPQKPFNTTISFRDVLWGGERKEKLWESRPRPICWFLALRDHMSAPRPCAKHNAPREVKTQIVPLFLAEKVMQVQLEKTTSNGLSEDASFL